jgi:hypothetical protein
VETRHAGVASAATNTSRELGGVFGIAFLGAVFTAAFNRGFLTRLVESGLPSAQAQGILDRAGAAAAAGSSSAGGGAADPLIAQAIQSSFVHAIHVGLLVAVVALLIASVVSAAFVRTHVGNHVDQGGLSSPGASLVRRTTGSEGIPAPRSGYVDRSGTHPGGHVTVFADEFSIERQSTVLKSEEEG